MPKPLLVSILAGVLSFSACYLSASNLFPSVLLLHFSAAPLFACAFLYGRRGVSLATGTALAVSLVSAAPTIAVFYATSIAAPAWVAGVLAVRRLEEPTPTAWYPVSKLLVWLTVYAAARVLVAGLLHAGEEGGFQAEVQKAVQEVLTQLPPEAVVNAKGLIGLFPYLIPVSGGWSWVLLFWFAAWFAHFVLKSYRLGMRSEFSLRFFLLPNWLLLLIAATAGASLVLQGEGQFVALIMTLILLLPYFLLGIMYIHSLTRPWPARWLVLTFVYLLMFKLWPILVVAILGIILHAHSISRHWLNPGDASGNS